VEWLRETTNTFSQGRDSNWEPPKYKSHELPLKSASPVTHSGIHDCHDGDGGGDDDDKDDDDDDDDDDNEMMMTRVFHSGRTRDSRSQ